MLGLGNTWLKEESELTNYAYKEKLLWLTLNPTEETFELCWTDYFAESGFDKIEKGEHLK